MLEFFMGIFVVLMVVGFFYGYYVVCKWLTYDFFTETPEKTGDWVDDYLIVYGKKTLGVLLLLPVAILLILALAAGSNKSSGSSSSGSRSDDSDGYTVYQLQVRGGTTWLNIGGSRNEDGAIRSADYEKSRNPDKQYRVVEKTRNGKIIGTVYSC